MHKKKIQIHIPEPCDQKWSNMSPSKGGRFCDQCEKTIVDFTQKSDKEIVNLYRKNKGKLCGRFHPSQLGRDFQVTSNLTSNARWKATGVLLSGVLSMGQMEGQEQITPPLESEIPLPPIVGEAEVEVEEKVEKRCTVIKGRITDELGEPLIGASILRPGGCVGTVADINGEWSMQALPGVNRLHFSYTGYAAVEQELNVDEATEEQCHTMDIVMTPDYISCTLGVVAIYESDRKLFNRVRNFFLRLKYGRQEKIKYKRALREERRELRKEKKIEKELFQVQEVGNGKEKSLEEIEVSSGLTASVFPNPFENQINLVLETDTPKAFEIFLFNEIGQSVYKEKINTHGGKNEIQLDLQKVNLYSGTYFLSILEDGVVLKTELLIRE